MKTIKILFSIFLLNFPIIASQFITSVELRKGDGVIFNQSGELKILKDGWMEQKNFDFSLELGNCPTVCGAECPLNILSKGKFFIYKSNPSKFPLYGQNINLVTGNFDTSSKYSGYDTIQSYNLPLIDNSKYYIFKTTSNIYFLFIIDSLKISGGCPPEMTLCCTAYGIDVIYGKIILQTNGLPQFEQPDQVLKRSNNSIYNKSTTGIYKTVDIQGRLIKNPLNSNGIQILVRENISAKESMPFCKLKVLLK